MTEPHEAPPKTLRYTCPFPGCSRSFRDFWRLKVHYRAAPGARGSGVERGHGMELPFCPLCNLDLRDVKYHKCAAGPAACAPASRSRSNPAVNSMPPRFMPGQHMGPYMMANGMMPYNAHQSNAPQGPYGFPNHTYTPGQHPGMQQQQQQQHQQQLVPGLPLLGQGSGNMQQHHMPGQQPVAPQQLMPGQQQIQPPQLMPGQQQQQQQQMLLQRSASAPNPRSISTATVGLPTMQTPAAAANTHPPGKQQWWPQGQQQQQQQWPQQWQQQQQMQLPHTSTPSGLCGSSSVQLPQQQQLPHMMQHTMHRASSTGGALPAAAAAAPTNMMLKPTSDHQHQQQLLWQQHQQPQNVYPGHAVPTAAAAAASVPASSAFADGCTPRHPQQQQQQQYQPQQPHSVTNAVFGTNTSSAHNTSRWLQSDAAATAARSSSYNTAAAAAGGPDNFQPQPENAAAAFQPGGMMRYDTMYVNNSPHVAAAAAAVPAQSQQQQQQSLHSPVLNPAAAEAAFQQQLPMYAAKIIEDFRADLCSLRSNNSGSSTCTAAVQSGSGPCTAASNGGATILQQQQQLLLLPPRGHSGSGSTSPVSSSEARSSSKVASAADPAAADLADGQTRIGMKRPLSALDHGAASANPAKRQAAHLERSSSTALAVSDGFESQGLGRNPGRAFGSQSGRSNGWTDTPPPSEAQEALLQLAAHAEHAALGVKGTLGFNNNNKLQEGLSLNLNSQNLDLGFSTGVNKGTSPNLSRSDPDLGFSSQQQQQQQQGFEPDDAHAEQVSTLLGAALEAANRCMQNPAPVVQQLLAVLDEHVSIVKQQHVLLQQHQQQQEIACNVAPAAAASMQQQQQAAQEDPFAAAAAAVAKAAAAVGMIEEAANEQQQQEIELQAPPESAAVAATGAMQLGFAGSVPHSRAPSTHLQQQQQQHYMPQQQQQQHLPGSSEDDDHNSPTVQATLEHFLALQQQSICIPRSPATQLQQQQQHCNAPLPPPPPPLPAAAAAATVATSGSMATEHTAAAAASMAAATECGSLSGTDAMQQYSSQLDPMLSRSPTAAATAAAAAVHSPPKITA